MLISRCHDDAIARWLPLRAALWPGTSEQFHGAEIAAQLDDPINAVEFIATADDTAVGFVDTTLRHDYVNGCSTSPVAFLEGIYVVPAWRRQGIGSRLCAAAEKWASAAHCSAFASDALLDNANSHRFHARLGFEETEIIVYFRKSLIKR